VPFEGRLARLFVHVLFYEGQVETGPSQTCQEVRPCSSGVQQMDMKNSPAPNASKDGHLNDLRRSCDVSSCVKSGDLVVDVIPKLSLREPHM